jgi:hypothetical protein
LFDHGCHLTVIAHIAAKSERLIPIGVQSGNISRGPAGGGREGERGRGADTL